MTPQQQLGKQIHQWSSHIGQRLVQLESEARQWQSFQEDYEALANQLRTFPDKTTHSAMIPMGKLAFMPGKFIHTNEILVYLGDQYYAERSAKQAVAIVERRKQAVQENYRLVEAQLNAMKLKSESRAGVFPSDTQELNEEGLPIMEIREPLPLNEKKVPSKTLKGKERDHAMKPEKKSISPQEEKENKALFDMLRRLEEEEAEMAENGSLHEHTPEKKRAVEMANEEQEEEEEEEWNEYYDTEVADSVFDHFEDDEEYATEGIVDHENFTYHEDPQARFPEERDSENEDNEEPTVTDTTVPADDLAAIEEEEEEAALKDVFEHSVTEQAVAPVEPVPKKISKFKQALQQKKEEEKKEAAAAAVEEEEENTSNLLPIVTSANIPKKPAFKVAPQQIRRLPDRVSESAAKPSPATSVKQTPSRFMMARQQQNNSPSVQSQPMPSTEDLDAQLAAREYQDQLDEKEYLKKQTAVLQANRQIPSVEPSRPKKVSKFKQARQQEKASASATASATAIPHTKDTPKRKVTWDAMTVVHEHERGESPSTRVGDSYQEPIKQEEPKQETSLHQYAIRSPEDIFRVLQKEQLKQVAMDEDGYPSLDSEDGIQDENTPNEPCIIDIKDLISTAHKVPQTLWRPNNGSDNEILPVSFKNEKVPLSRLEDGKAKSKMDSVTMRGKVMERETEPIEIEEMEDDMYLKEITSDYQRKRQEMLAAMGELSFDSKPEFKVIDEDLPLPSKDKEQDQETIPKKMSRFKAARLGLTLE
ncbi:hypothetical protein BDF14DRAFT_1881667 [Spinellus fusiger]|nr:hypothetical protein BDF14DRAFT_1881667 [Spinellus fusiger]